MIYRVEVTDEEILNNCGGSQLADLLRARHVEAQHKRVADILKVAKELETAYPPTKEEDLFKLLQETAAKMRKLIAD